MAVRRGPRRRARAAVEAGADREPCAIDHRRRRRAAGGDVGRERARESSLPPNVLPVPDIGVDRTVVLFRLACRPGNRARLRPGARVAGGEDRRQRRAQGGRPFGDRGRPLDPAPGARRRGARARDGAAHRRGPAACGPWSSCSACRSASIPTASCRCRCRCRPRITTASRRVAFYRDLGHALKAMPGVQSAGISSGIPFGVGNYTTSPFTAPGKSAAAARTSRSRSTGGTAGPGYFATVRIPLLRGRDFTDADTATSPQVMIVSRAPARTLWGDEDPIGRTVRRVADGSEFTVIGVVGDVRSTTLNRESPARLLRRRSPDVAADGHRRPAGG